MNQRQNTEDPEPSEPVPAGQFLVPVRSGPLGHTARLFRTPLGDRTAVAFSSLERLTAVLGDAQPWIALAEPALRALTEPLGVTTLTMDPQLAAPAPKPLPARATAAAAVPARSAAPFDRRMVRTTSAA
ncbi:SAV_915 family protein [Kitasatospora sp. NPDC008050]|uniref:SAV_915 family protein n=1 Tax=Kitasatospora sp. NPDC008050 TaxID=3364021 RepID=UPI0036E1024D